MAGFDRALDDLFGSGRADRGMGISEYTPAFGAEELAAVEGARSRITGRPKAQVGQTGFYGRALGGFNQGIQAQAAASGDLSAGARGAKNAAQIAADIQIGRDRVAADRATAAAQTQARQNIAAGLGSVIDSTRTAIENPLLQAAMKGVEEDRQDRLALRRDMAELQAPIDESVGEMARIARGRLESRLPRLGRPGLEWRGREAPVPRSMERILARVPLSLDRRDIQGDSALSYIDAIEEQAYRDVDKRNREAESLRRLRESLGHELYEPGSGVVDVVDEEALRREQLDRVGASQSIEDMLLFGGM